MLEGRKEASKGRVREGIIVEERWREGRSGECGKGKECENVKRQLSYKF